MSDEESSGPELSENEEDVDDQKNLSLLKAISAMDGQKRPEMRMEAYSMSEYSVPSIKGKVNLHELVGALRNDTTHGTLKKQLDRAKKKEKVLSVPLSRPEQEKVHRVLAYEDTKKGVSKWQSIIDKNRQADQLKFPLEQVDLRMLTSPADLLKRSTPKTSLELEVAALLGSSEHVLESDKLLTPAEEKALKAMSIEEAKERRAELKKYRALLTYKEAKARRQNKIKSKRYRRILKKERLKKEEKDLEKLEKSDPEAYVEKLKLVDAERIKERISLKHRGGSKFAKKQMMYKKYDGPTRDAIQDMLHKSRELTKKVVMETDSSEEEEVDSNVVEESLPTQSKQNQANPWMVSGAKIRKYSKPQSVSNPVAEAAEEFDTEADIIVNDDEEEEEDAMKNVNIDTLFDKLEDGQIKTVRQMRSRRHKHNVEKAESSGDEDDEENELVLGSDEEREDIQTDKDKLQAKAADSNNISMSLKRKKTMDDFNVEDLDSEDAESGDEREPMFASRKSSTVHGEEVGSTDKAPERLSVDPKNFMTIGAKSSKPVLVEGGSDSSDEDDQTMTIAEAFAADDIVEEFQREKNDVCEEDKPKDINLSLPGWGDWGGQGIKPSKRKKKRFTIKAPPPAPRKDRNLDNVIISETKDQAIAKYQVNNLPYPFAKVEQFESSIRQPIGKTWNPETTYRKLIKPKVVTQLGSIIAPIDKDAVLKNQKHKGNKLAFKKNKQQKTNKR